MTRISVVAVKTLVHCLALLPACWLFWQGLLLYKGLPHDLSANPIQFIHHYTGNWAIRFILLGLLITPLRRLGGWNSLIKFRRMIGLYSFFYVMLHLLNFIGLDYFFDWPTIMAEIIKRPAISFGMIAVVGLVPLAVTSTRGWVRRLRHHWVQLHRLIYPVALLAVVHNIMMVKADIFIPLVHLSLLVLLLGFRLFRRRAPKSRDQRKGIRI